MAFGIKICKRGFNVFASATKDLLATTEYPLLKVKQSGSGSLSVSDGSGDSDVIAHNLGYTPRVLVYGQTYELDAGTKNSTYTGYPFYQGFAGPYLSWFYYTVDNNNLTIYGDLYDETSFSGTFDYFYYIFYDEN